MLGRSRILSVFPNSFNLFDKTLAPMHDPHYIHAQTQNILSEGGSIFSFIFFNEG